jgi:predicted nucleic acid-binding protein
MEILYPPELILFLKHKHLLLDTNIFRDAANKPTVFNDFFNKLKTAEVTLTTIDCVKYELLKGSADSVKYKAKEKLIGDIIDVTIPIIPKTSELAFGLIQQYGIDGTVLSITDLMIGATLMQYKKNICLMTRDTSDFIQSIFELPFIINATHAKGIFTYGVYQYRNLQEPPF